MVRPTPRCTSWRPISLAGDRKTTGAILYAAGNNQEQSPGVRGDRRKGLLQHDARSGNTSRLSTVMACDTNETLTWSCFYASTPRTNVPINSNTSAASSSESLNNCCPCAPHRRLARSTMTSHGQTRRLARAIWNCHAESQLSGTPRCSRQESLIVGFCVLPTAALTAPPHLGRGSVVFTVSVLSRGPRPPGTASSRYADVEDALRHTAYALLTG
ncbi:hypothetical protein HDK77DRAFT_87696 [Phyllosticta capitalensis]